MAGLTGMVWHSQHAAKVDLFLHNTPRGVSHSDPSNKNRKKTLWSLSQGNFALECKNLLK